MAQAIKAIENAWTIEEANAAYYQGVKLYGYAADLWCTLCKRVITLRALS